MYVLYICICRHSTTTSVKFIWDDKFPKCVLVHTSYVSYITKLFLPQLLSSYVHTLNLLTDLMKIYPSIHPSTQFIPQKRKKSPLQLLVIIKKKRKKKTRYCHRRVGKLFTHIIYY